MLPSGVPVFEGNHDRVRIALLFGASHPCWEQKFTLASTINPAFDAEIKKRIDRDLQKSAVADIPGHSVEAPITPISSSWQASSAKGIPSARSAAALCKEKGRELPDGEYRRQEFFWANCKLPRGCEKVTS